jgi:hypothetical protein
MMKLRSALCAASLLALYSAAASAEAVAGKTVQLSKVVLDTETAEVAARVKGGTLCVFPSTVKLPKEKKTQDYERFDNLFTAAMKSGGFSVVSTSGDMFAGEDGKNKADYLVGVTLRPLEMNICSSVKGEKGKVSIAAYWQIYDRSAGRVVEDVMTTADGVQEKFATDGLDQMVNSAFAANLSALISQGVVQKHVAKSSAELP